MMEIKILISKFREKFKIKSGKLLDKTRFAEILHFWETKKTKRMDKRSHTNQE